MSSGVITNFWKGFNHSFLTKLQFSIVELNYLSISGAKSEMGSEDILLGRETHFCHLFFQTMKLHENMKVVKSNRRSVTIVFETVITIWYSVLYLILNFKNEATLFFIRRTLFTFVFLKAFYFVEHKKASCRNLVIYSLVTKVTLSLSCHLRNCLIIDAPNHARRCSNRQIFIPSFCRNNFNNKHDLKRSALRGLLR